MRNSLQNHEGFEHKKEFPSVRATLELLLELFCDGLVSLTHRLLGLSGFKLLIPLDFFFTGLLLASLLRFLVGLPNKHPGLLFVAPVALKTKSTQGNLKDDNLS